MNRVVLMLFRIGPGPLIVLMVLGSAIYYPWRHYDSWPAFAILAGALLTLLWHLALILKRPIRDRFIYALYASVNLGLYLFLGIFCLMAVSGDAL